MWNSKDNNMIKILGDEYGYWSAGSFFSGLDWSEVTNNNSYYEIGYGILLSLLFRTGFSAAICYKLAIFANAIFLCLIFSIVLKLTCEYLSDGHFSFYLKISIAFAITVLSCQIYFTQYTMSEVLICLIYWTLIFLMHRLQKKITFLGCCAFTLLLVYSYFVHQRMIGIAAIGFIFLLYLSLTRKSDLKKVLFSVLCAACLFVLFSYMKNVYKDTFFSGGESAYYALNNFSGQVGKLQKFFSLEGLLNFIQAYIGKIFYAMSSTYLLPAVAFGALCSRLYSIVKIRGDIEQRERKELEILVFMFLNAFAMMAISSIYMIDFSGRFDLLLYGRYFEFTLLPLVWFTLVWIVRKNRLVSWRSVFNIIIVFLIVTIIVNVISDYNAPSTHIFNNCSGIAAIFYLIGEKVQWLWLVAIQSIVFFFVILIWMNQKENRHKFLVLLFVLMACWNIWGSSYVFEKGCLRWAKEQAEASIELSNIINDLEIEDSLYYYTAESNMGADEIQFLLKDYSIHCFNDWNELEVFDGHEYLLTQKSTEKRRDLFLRKYTIIHETKALTLWKKKDD